MVTVTCWILTVKFSILIEIEFSILIESLQMRKGTAPLETACLGMSPFLHNPRCINWSKLNMSNSESLQVPFICLVPAHCLFPPLSVPCSKRKIKGSIKLEWYDPHYRFFWEKWRFFSSSIKLFQSHVIRRLLITTNTTLPRHFLFQQLFKALPAWAGISLWAFLTSAMIVLYCKDHTSLICLLSYTFTYFYFTY